jgi:hypothetical protein
MEKFQNPGLDPERKAQLQDHIAHLEGMLKKHEEAQEKQKPPERTYAQVKKEYDEAIAERYKWIKKIDVLRTGSWPGEKYKQEASDAIKEEQKAANLVYKLANERKEIMVANPPWDIKKMSEETRTKVKDYLEEIAGETITAGKEAKIQEMLGIELDDPNFQIAYEGNTFSPVPVKYLTVRYGKDSFSGSNRIASATYYP